MTTPNPAAHPAHDTPLADRIIEDSIRSWLDTRTGLMRAAADPSEYPVIDRMRHLHLDGYWYTLVPDITKALRRAGLLT